jgi:hypothetical protein
MIFGDNTKIDKNISPQAYWTHMVLYMFGCLGLFITVIFGLREVIVENKRISAMDKENKVLTNTETREE